jgi:hypothetical protein
MIGGTYGTVAVNNASAGVLAKAVIAMGPVTLTAGTLQLSDTLVYSATNTSNAITQSAGSVLTLNNSQTLIPSLTNVARNSFGGFYSILHSVYDKPNSTFTGTSLNSISYSQYINADRIGIGTTNATSNLYVVGDEYVTGVVTASSFSGSGASLTGIIAGVGIKTSGGTVGTGATILDFRGTGISTITVASGIATINIQNATTTRTVTAFNSTAGQTTFSVTYTPGYLDVYLNGSKLSASEYTANNGTSIVLNEGASLNDVLEAVSYTTLLVTSTSSDYATIAGYSTSSGLASLATYATTAGIATYSGTAGISTYATTAGISTTSQGLTGTPNISVGIITATDHRILSVGERTTLVNGNTVSLVYNTGGGNVAICTNPSGDIALNVTGIPTDTNFNNYSLTFSVIVSNTGTARSCTTVSLNGVSTTIKWFGGSIISAISGVTTSNGYDIYSFSGINTVGSASTTTNYTVLGSVNGGYR